MKSRVYILLIIFSLVQFGPAIKSMVSYSINTIFAVDEEKNSSETEKSSDDTKGKNEFSRQQLALRLFNPSSLLIFHHKEKLNLSPTLEILTPPPNKA